MNSQIDVTPYTSAPIEPTSNILSGLEVISLLRQLIEIQREQLELARGAAAARDMGARWRAFLARWQNEFPELSRSCREVLPILERSYGTLLGELVDNLRQEGTEDFGTDFALQEFLDKYGMRLAQLGGILNLVGPLAEAAGQTGDRRES